MDPRLQTIDMPFAGPIGSVEQRNRVLRNTYWLLALSMIPTVLGAWIGVTTGALAAISPLMFMVVFLAGAFGFIFAIEKTKNSAAGVPVLLGFTFFMGLMLSQLLSLVLGLGNGASIIMTAFAGTAVVFVGMAALSTVIKRDLSVMAKFLYVGVIMLIVAMVANLFLQSSAFNTMISVVTIGIFSAFIAFHLQRVKNGIETNYITATLGIYISLFNVFTALLSILSGGNRN
jgi:modulator of FtsH protease